VRALEIISEASRRLPNDLLHRHPEIDWAAVAAAGNVYRHEYEAVDEALIWYTVRHGLSAIRSGRGGDASPLGGPAAELPAAAGQIPISRLYIQRQFVGRDPHPHAALSDLTTETLTR
jgi:hypothetical protein